MSGSARSWQGRLFLTGGGASLDVETLYGRIKFEPTGQIAMSQVLVQILDGKVVPVYVAGRFVNEPVYPAPKWSERK